MNAIQPSIEPPSYPFADWLGEAIALVQRVNARLRPETPPPSPPILRHGRHVLTDSRCLLLAALVDSELAA
jgi:hypothetical protein